jgi:hypothetical protein
MAHIDQRKFVEKIKNELPQYFNNIKVIDCGSYDVNGNIKIRKNEADKSAKVDGIVAMIIAAHCSLDNAFVSNSFGFRSF